MGGVRFVWINSRSYLAEPLANDTGRAWRITKPDGTAYDLRETEDGGAVCDCGWFSWKCEPGRRVCKHVLALQREGMLTWGETTTT